MTSVRLTAVALAAALAVLAGCGGETTTVTVAGSTSTPAATPSTASVSADAARERAAARYTRWADQANRREEAIFRQIAGPTCESNAGSTECTQAFHDLAELSEEDREFLTRLDVPEDAVTYRDELVRATGRVRALAALSAGAVEDGIHASDEQVLRDLRVALEDRASAARLLRARLGLPQQ